MSSQTDRESAAAAMERINRAWLDRRPADLHALLHPDLTMALPGFVGRVDGRQALVAGFEDFCAHATVEGYRESNQQVDVVGDTAVVSFDYQMVYERSGQRNKATGRDLWVFARHGGAWLAVWRTMLNLQEQPAQRGYSGPELRDLTAGLDCYHWDIGTVRGKWLPFPIAYLIGVPSEKSAETGAAPERGDSAALQSS